MYIETQKKKFANHVATFTDYGNIKILDFKNPNSGDYRIRFLFEEDYCRLHISGDLGHLIASNYRNMCWAKFHKDFANNHSYFEEKIDCHDRPLYEYEVDTAKKELAVWIQENGIDEDEIEEKFYCSVDEFIKDILEKLDNRTGLAESAIEKLCDVALDSYEANYLACGLGKTSTGIIDLYLLAFRLAYEQLSAKP